MTRHTAILIASSILTLGLPLSRPAAAQSALPQVFLTISNQADVPADVLAGARAEVSRIYKAIGVDVVFTAEPSTDPGHRFIVNLVPERMGHWSSTRPLGTALVGGILAYVVFERVERFAKSWGNDVTTTLGLALAHELGHLLLQNGAHAVSGLMSPVWSSGDAGLAGAGRLLFWPAEGARIRKAVAVGK